MLLFYAINVELHISPTSKKKNAKMNKEEKQLKISLIKTRNSIKKKYRDLHKQRLALDETVREQYKPIITPLNKLAENSNKKTSKKNRNQNIKSEKNNVPGLLIKKTPEINKDADSYEPSKTKVDAHALSFETPKIPIPLMDKKKIDFDAAESPHDILTDDDEHADVLNDDDDDDVDSNDSTEQFASPNQSPIIMPNDIKTYLESIWSDKYDLQFGIRKYNDALYIGSSPVTLDNIRLIVKNNRFNVTRGLLDLLFFKKPVGYTESDLAAYKEILTLTNAHRKFFNPNESFRGAKSYKYKRIIEPLFTEGSGIQTEYMKYGKGKVSYTYWDDPNELVERLRLLVASSSAGHTGHNNEIISIIEELREENIIA